HVSLRVVIVPCDSSWRQRCEIGYHADMHTVRPHCSAFHRPRVLLATFFCALFVRAAACDEKQDSTQNREGVEFFETRIRPVLVQECYACHSSKAKRVQAGLLLDTRA